MLNKDGVRQLAYLVKIDNITPIPGYDRVELAHVGGWTIVVGKGEFKVGDPAVYFEIDSKLPEVEPFTDMEFLAKKKYRIRTQKMCKSLSMGLLISVENFGWVILGDGSVAIDKDTTCKVNDESRFLTKRLNVTYAVEEDNKRKAKSNPDAKINAALARHPKIAKKYGKFIKKNKIARKVFLLFFGRKRDVRNWPQEVAKTDEERIENLVWRLNDPEKKWIATEKIDGSSTTFHMRRATFLKPAEYFVCSRNVVFDTPNKKNYYSDTIDSNIYIDMSEKYNMREVLEKLLKDRPSADWVTVQGETFGNRVQKRDYGMKDRDFRAFNLIYSDCGRINTLKMIDILDKYGVPSVPVVRKIYHLPATIDQLRAFVHSEKSLIDGEIKEGIVFRSEDGSESFKCVDPEFLLLFHG